MLRKGIEVGRQSLATHGPSFVRFATVGLVNLAIDMAIFSALHFGLGVALIPANTVAFVVAVTNSFFMNRQWTFADRRGNGRLAYQVPMFFALNTVGLGISTATVWCMALVVHVLIAKCAAVVVTCVWNYTATRRFVYGGS
ncbi:MAG: GtrA family protein [Rhodospirillaceae bacterium]